MNDLEIKVDEPFEPTNLTQSQMILGGEILERFMICLHEKGLAVYAGTPMTESFKNREEFLLLSVIVCSCGFIVREK
jgi:hypothetical protein